MQILCKYKDFYDYKCYEFGIDPFPTFDRRECNKLTNSGLFLWVNSNNYFCERLFYLEVGYSKYIFSAPNIEKVKDDPIMPIYDGEIHLVRVIKESKKTWTKEMTLSHLHFNYFRKKPYRNRSILTCDEDDLDYGNKNSIFSRYYKDKIELPILADTKLAGLLDPQEIFANLDMYLRSLHNDVNRESEGITDKEKAVNKGFNKRESFRNIHPRS